MRIRTVKPEFFKHEALFEAELAARLPLRLAFIGLWGVADREGRFKWRPRQIKTDILPYDDVDFSAVMDALEASGFIQRYGDAGEYGCIPTFSEHQCVNTREAQSTLPEPTVRSRASTCVHVQAHSHAPNGENIPGPLRETVIARDGRKCLRCGAKDDLTVDHIFPRSIGGTHAITNLRTLCRPCNSARPVQGDGLIQDLARDGFTMDDMQRMCAHVQVQGEGKGKEGNRKGTESTSSTPSAAGGELVLTGSPPPTSEHTAFIDGWAQNFRATFGADYQFDGGRDAKAVKGLLKMGILRIDLLEIAKRAWAASRRDGRLFGCKQAVTIHGLKEHFNKVQAELSTAQPKAEPKQMQEIIQVKAIKI
jgi:5-methylcytosine-specific restriction endonuclease McrA